MPENRPAPQPPRVPSTEIPGLQALLAVVVGVVAVAALYLGREVLVPITLAVLLSFVLAPVVDLLRRLWLGRVPAVLLAVLLALGAILFVGGLIGTQVAGLARDAPSYAATIERKVAAVRAYTVGRFSEVMDSFGRGLGHGGAGALAPAAALQVPPPSEEPRPLPVEVRQPAASPLELAERVLAPVLHPLATTGIVLVVAVFVLLQREDLRDRLIRLAGATDLHRTTTALDDAARRLSRYFLFQLGLNTAFGCLICAGLYAIGVPSPILWGIVATLLRFVPYIGAFLAAALPMALAAAVDPGWSVVVWTAALFLVAEPLMGHVVEPMVYGHSTGLSPLSVIVAAIFWGWLWGPVGLILSTPLTLCLVVLGRHVEQLEFLDILLGDRPALTPVESFYQRMLAGDPDEALDQAELLLKERSLSSYYDEVALKGLQLAASDVSRGVLPPERLEVVKEAVRSFVADLSGHDDAEPSPDKAAANADTASLAERALPKEPPPSSNAPPADALPPEWRSERAILCIAGRGPLDEAAAAMLAQVLSKHGLGAVVVPHGAVARGRVDSLDVSGVAMVCISYLEISGNPAHLRYLLRRLRQRLPPGAPILVGLWPAEEAVFKDPQVQKQIGADHYTSSLREAVTASSASHMRRAQRRRALLLAALLDRHQL
ncbi:MAG TPA: AI-2E family transporter [Chloroflexia bacterium]|nr:AI-2E family transporter [Chloroflexia bacterium]